MKAKLSFEIAKDEYSSFLIKDIDHTKDEFLKNIVNKYLSEDSSYSSIFRSVTYYAFGLNDKGKCSKCTKTVEKFKYKNRTVKLISPKSSNDNCLIMCFAHVLDIKGNTINFKQIREKYEIPDGGIDFKDVYKIADYFNTGFILLNEKQEIIGHKDLIDQPKVHIMLMKEYYYVVEYLDYKVCQDCGRKLLDSNEDHKCANKRVSFYHRQRCNKKDFVAMIDCSDDNKIDEGIFKQFFLFPQFHPVSEGN
jgi:hypothetical protein